MTGDAETVEALRRRGVAGDQWLRHGFTFLANEDGAELAAGELRSLGFRHLAVDEEVTGDTYWHVAAFRVESPDDDQLAGRRTALSELAARHGGHYTGWDLAELGNGSVPDPTNPLD